MSSSRMVTFFIINIPNSNFFSQFQVDVVMCLKFLKTDNVINFVLMLCILIELRETISMLYAYQVIIIGSWNLQHC
jgi:hypothetical protein